MAYIIITIKGSTIHNSMRYWQSVSSVDAVVVVLTEPSDLEILWDGWGGSRVMVESVVHDATWR